MSVAQIDLILWMRYSGRLENDQMEPVLFDVFEHEVDMIIELQPKFQ